MFESGFVLNNRYEIKSRMQESNDLYDYYQVFDRNNNCEVMIKALNKSFSWDTGIVSKFKTVAREMCTIKSRYILNVSDWGCFDDTYYMVLENIKGISLKRYIEKKSQINSKEAISILIQVCYGLQEAHGRHIIHGELTSENILISTEGVIKVTGFCLPRSLKSDRIKYYYPPEITEKNPADERSDIYILGIILYEMLTKYTPFDGDSAAEIIEKHRTHPFPSIRERRVGVQPYVKIIVYKCCEKNPDSRYQSVGELLDVLKSALLKVADEEKGISTEKTVSHEEGSVNTGRSELRMEDNNRPGAVSTNRPVSSEKSTVLSSKSSEDFIKIRSVIRKAIELLAADILLDKRLFITVVEDLAPELVSEKEFLTRTYSDDVGKLLHSAYRAGDGSDYSVIDSYLLNNCGFNDNWRHRFFSFFSFIFPNAADNSITDMRKDANVKTANHPDAGVITLDKENVPNASPEEYNSLMKAMRDVESKRYGSRPPARMKKDEAGSHAGDKNRDSFNDPDGLRNPSIFWGLNKDIHIPEFITSGTLEEVLRSSILNKNNHLYSVTGELPKEVKKLWKNQWKYYNDGRKKEGSDVKAVSYRKGQLDKEKILFALTVENTFGVQEGIVVTKETMICITKLRATKIPFDRVKDVKTYIQGTGLAIKVMLDDGSIIATDINSEKYDIKPIVAYLESIKKS
ncbi:MAG: protein kinase [Lachnospiraceae bacterium]|nr:protein kinase [Lachnospiraceae bacterium]